VQLAGSTVSLQPGSSVGSGEYALVSVDGLAPQVDTLPPPSSTYAGREFAVSGSSYTVYRCVLGQGGVYAWVSV
jgi:hypothetical protein